MIVATSAPPSGAIVISHDKAAKALAGDPGQSGSYQEQPEKPFPYGLVDRTINEPVALFTLALVVSTFLLWRATMRIARDSKESGITQAAKMERSAVAMEGVKESMAINADQIVRSVDLQKQYGQMQLRPYLVVLVGTGLLQTDKLRFQVDPKVLNTGATPARNVSWRIKLAVVGAKDAEAFKFPLPEKVGGANLIAQHQDYNLSAALPDRVSDEDAVQLASAGPDKLLFVYGCVSYRDGFKRRYLTTFAQQVWWEIQRDKDGNVTAAPLRGRYLFKHNRAN
jgi:hypothetical protein